MAAPGKRRSQLSIPVRDAFVEPVSLLTEELLSPVAFKGEHLIEPCEDC